MLKRFALLLGCLCLMVTPLARAEYDMPADAGDYDPAVFVETEETFSPAVLEVEAPSCILMEASTGTVLYEKDADTPLEPASVTKVMTILLIAEAIDSGALNLTDTITVSAYAAGMGGSQIFLEEGEQMSADDMLKSIVVASANDAAVAMAEHLCGSESAFAAKMNQRAKELGMENTHFSNCTGLLEDPEHRTSARDIALMSAEVLKHPWITRYTTIWTDTVRQGAFGLSNTNKLIRFYEGATGLKTGFTSSAGYCLSATALRDGVQYIAVVMHCPTSQGRFDSARELLSYAFSNYTLYTAEPESLIQPVPVTLGKADFVAALPDKDGTLVVDKGALGEITTSLEMEEKVAAPVYMGQKLGTFTVKLGEEVLFSTPVVAGCDVEKLSVWDLFLELLGCALGAA